MGSRGRPSGSQGVNQGVDLLSPRGLRVMPTGSQGIRVMLTGSKGVKGQATGSQGVKGLAYGVPGSQGGGLRCPIGSTAIDWSSDHF